MVSGHDELKARSSLKIEEKSLREALKKSKLRLARLIEKENEIMSNKKHRTVVSRGQPTFGHFQVSIYVIFLMHEITCLIY